MKRTFICCTLYEIEIIATCQGAYNGRDNLFMALEGVGSLILLIWWNIFIIEIIYMTFEECQAIAFFSSKEIFLLERNSSFNIL